jgi:RNA polymerase sigma factor (sigma-70 family)
MALKTSVATEGPRHRFHRQLQSVGLADIIVLPEGFDPADDQSVEQVAGQLLSHFRAVDDVQAYVMLVELTQRHLQRVARSITRRLALMIDADDLVATFMAQLFTDVRKGQPEVRRFLSLAYTVMRYDALNQLRLAHRSRARCRSFGERSALARAPCDPSAALDGREQTAALKRLGTLFFSVVNQCFHALSLRDRRVLICREIEGMSYDELAAALQMPRTQVGMILKRARDRLAQAIERAMPGHHEPPSSTASATASVAESRP